MEESKAIPLHTKCVVSLPRTMTTSVIVKSQVKQYAKLDGKPLSVAEEFYKALEEKVKKDIEQACERAKLNSRNTVMARDL